MSMWTDEAWAEANKDAMPGPMLFSEVVSPTAAITHDCDACRGTIQPGNRYRREVFMHRGDPAPSVTKTHIDCYAEGEF